eukprot:TRINITY_DN50285_c0_g1_i1.p1 TRINITY_DN50285_c0_g1~~TRINITY_DN50285_c0_g1_i1.p1  ORF type:complete len:569 (+),score=55.38 TRINITY_DN50285_c0_g1_i1:67-1707(+)
MSLATPRTLKVAGASSDETDDEELERKDTPSFNCEGENVMARLRPDTESIYEDAFFVPLVARASGHPAHKASGGSGCLFLSRRGFYASFLMFLSINFMGHLLAIFKMSTIITGEYNEGRELLFTHCNITKLGDLKQALYPFLVAEHIHLDEVMDCVSRSFAPFLSPSALGLNKDGVWSREEAVFLERSRANGERHDDYLVDIFEHIQQLDHQKLEHQSGLLPLQTPRPVQGVDAKWLSAHANKLRICVEGDKYLCLQMETDGRLTKTFPSITQKWIRIRACEETVEKFCPAVFGEAFLFRTMMKGQLCGPVEVEWDSHDHIRKVSHEKTLHYRLRQDAISSWTYVSYFALILAIWFALNLKEIHETLRFLFILVHYPSAPSDDEHFAYENENGKLVITRIPIDHKWFAFTCIWLPRVVTECYLLVAGTQFLCIIDDYVNLLLNSTALAFMMELDNVLHFAFVSPRFLAMTGKCEQLKMTAKAARHDFVIEHFGLITLSLLVGLVAVTVSMTFYRSDGGKLLMTEAIQCFCESEGPRCLTQLLVPDW